MSSDFVLLQYLIQDISQQRSKPRATEVPN
jgi:hypothetical protein